MWHLEVTVPDPSVPPDPAGPVLVLFIRCRFCPARRMVTTK